MGGNVKPLMWMHLSVHLCIYMWVMQPCNYRFSAFHSCVHRCSESWSYIERNHPNSESRADYQYVLMFYVHLWLYSMCYLMTEISEQRFKISKHFGMLHSIKRVLVLCCQLTQNFKTTEPVSFSCSGAFLHSSFVEHLKDFSSTLALKPSRHRRAKVHINLIWAAWVSHHGSLER